MNVLRRRGLPDLERWEAAPFSSGMEAGAGLRDRRDRYARIVGSERPGPPAPDGPYRRVADAIFGYRVFPPDLITGVLRRRPVQVGDTVGIQYHGFRVMDLFFAARVTEVFDVATSEGGRAGFTYRTLEGHPELGEETFAVEKHLDGTIEVCFTSWSRPGSLAGRLFPHVMRAAQVHGNTRAMAHLARIAG